MPINMTSVGAAGTHSFRRTNINVDDDFIYFKNTGGDVIPAALQNAASFIYTAGVGSIEGFTEAGLLYVTTTEPKKLTFSATSGGAARNITGYNAGSIKFNTPIVFDGRLNIDSSTASNQAVKYFTTGTPLGGLTSGETYFLRNVSVSDFAGQQTLYSFSSHTFTTCGQTGRTGPTLNQMRSAYASAGWSSAYLNLGNHNGYQDWTVPVSGVYEFTVNGASGFNGTGAGSVGRGATVRGRVSLTKGEIITIVVGQVGNGPTTGTLLGGSGGASWVVRKTGNQPLFVAGGGTAEPNTGAGRDGVLTQLGGTSTSGSLAGGAVGFGGRASSPNGFSAAGGGFNSRGENSPLPGSGIVQFGGGSFLDGLTMNLNTRGGGYGGFGGGGQSDANNFNQAAGAGGYSGGGGARSSVVNHSGGGGGSFIVNSATNVATSTGLFDGISTFGGSAITNLASFNTGEGSVGVSLVSSFTTGNRVYPTAVDAENDTNRIAITPQGNSFHSLVPINYDAQNDLIYSSVPHTLIDGEAITATFQNGAPAGLSNGSIYYVNVVNAYTYRLSTTPAPTFTTINLTIPARRDTGTSSFISRVVVNTATDTLTISNHGFLVDQPLRYDVGGGTAIAPLQDQVTYYVSQVVNANQIRLKSALNSPSSINFTAAGTGTSHSFIFLTVNELEDTLYIPNHGLVSGQAVRYQNNGNTSVTGLVNNTLYYVLKVDNSIIKLATNKSLSTIANITGPGTGTHSLILTPLDFDTDTITVPNHGFLQGELVQYDAKGQTVISGLTSATPYYVIFIDGDNIKLATTPENASAGTAVNLLASPAGVGRHSLQSLSKTPDGIYTITSVPSPTSFVTQAAGNVPPIVDTFNPRSTIDLTLNTFLIPSHGFSTGTSVTYSQGPAATDISGLVNGTQYYVVAINRDYLRLATTPENAAAGITLTVSDYGTGVAHSFTSSQINGNITGSGSVTIAAGSVLVNGTGTSFSKILKVGDRFRIFPNNITTSFTFAAADVNTTTNRITKSHPFVTGESVKFSAGGGVAPSPLVDGYYYFVRRLSATELTLHNSAADATNNTNPADFSTQGTGSAFTLIKTTPVSPIIRRITAIGSDTQITVDRPYANAYTAVSYSYPTFIYVRPQGYSLHRPFDGGVEMSVGANTSLGQIIRQTRKYFRYQSGKGLQTSCGINFQPSIDIESLTRFSSTTIEAKTRRPHGLISGLFIRISQAEDSFGNISNVYNGDFQVTVVDLTTFRFSRGGGIPEARAYGFPQFYVREWSGGAVRSGMFDFQNGMFFEFDGQEIYCVRRSSTQQLAGTASALQGSELIFGTGTSFQAQLDVGDYIVMRGQSYRVTQIDSNTRMSVRPEYKGSSGTEKEFNPQTVVNTSTNTFAIIGHGFSNLLPVVYNSIDGEVIGGLINGRTYYVDLIDNNSFKLKASPDSVGVVDLSTTGTTTIHSFTPAKSGIIMTKTVDTKVPQAQWSIDICDGSGPTGYNLDISRIQMSYIDYSWYGAGKIRFGFKTVEGQVQYVHEFVHNNNLYESYFRSGNLPARYEVVTYNDPTYIPYLFHWGTSVIMDGRFDDDNAYLFTAGSQTLSVPGTTAKSFASAGINITTDLITVQSHGFTTGEILQFQSISTNSLPGTDSLNPATQIIGLNTFANLSNNQKYRAFVNSTNLIHLTPLNATISLGSQQLITVARSGSVVTVTTTNPHNISNTGNNNVGIYASGVANIPDFVGAVSITSPTSFTYTVSGTQTVNTTTSTTIAISEVINFTTQGNSQYTYFLYPDGSLNNTSGPNYQPLISLRLSPSVSEGLTGKLGDRDVINRMQLRLQEVAVSTTQLVDVKVLLNPRLNNLNFAGVDSPSLTQVVEHTAADTVSGGVQVYNFRAAGGSGGVEAATTVDISTLFELSNSILGGDSIFPDGPDILTIAVSRLTGNSTLTSAKLSWAEAQA